MIHCETLVFNNFQVNCYLLWDESKECLLVDPAFYTREEQDALQLFLKNNGLSIGGQLNTHCHVDHILGLDYLKSEHGLPVRAHREESNIIANAPLMGDLFGWSVKPVGGIDEFLEEGADIPVGKHLLRVLHVPGHSPGSVALYSKEGGFVITGDALFSGSIGRTDLPGGDYDTLITSIREKLLSLPPETKVLPGHGPSSTIGREREENPFLK